MRFLPEEVEAYRRDGYVLRRQAFDEAELVVLRQHVEEVIAAVKEQAARPDGGPEMRLGDGHRMQFSSQTVIQWEWRDGSQEVRLIEPFTHLHPRFTALWGDARLADPFRDMLGVESVAPYTCKLNLKRPREGSEFPWHQDFTYWYAFTPEHAHQIGTTILFLDDALAENGAIRVLPGSHRAPAARDPEDPTRFLADPRRIAASEERLVAAEAGSLLFFPSLLLHRSSPNTSDRQRRAILLSYQPSGRPRQSELTWQPDRVAELP